MNGLQGIRNINSAAALRAGENVKPLRFQVQMKGNQWGTFDSHTGGFGLQSSDYAEVDRDCDRLNEQHESAKLTPLDIAERENTAGAALRAA